MPALMGDVAKRAGVSITTVSHVINGTREIAPATRERVMEAIKELHYYKNNSARLLVRGHSDTVGLLISDIENPFLPELVKSFERAAAAAGLELLLGMTNYKRNKAEVAVRRMIESRVRGVAVMTSQLDEDLFDRLLQAELPVVMLNAPRVGRLKGSVSVDYSAGIFPAVEHLHQLGHRDVGIIHGPLQVLSASYYLELLRDALAEYGIRSIRTVEGDGGASGGARGARTLLGMKRPPTAILCGNDLTAIGALGTATRMGRNVPEELSIVGCDDIAMASYSQPSLSTVRIPRDAMGQQAFHLLEKMVGAKSRRGGEAVVAAEYIARGSTGAVKLRRYRTKPPADGTNGISLVEKKNNQRGSTQ